MLNTVAFQVTDTNGQVLAHRENIHGDKGKFAFTTDTYDVFEVS